MSNYLLSVDFSFAWHCPSSQKGLAGIFFNYAGDNLGGGWGPEGGGVVVVET